MLAKESVLKEVNKEDTFTQVLKDWRKIKRTSYQNLDNLQKLQAKLPNCSSQSRESELLYEFSFRLSPGDKHNDAFFINSF